MAPRNIGTNKWRLKVSVLDKTKGYPVGKQETFRGTRAEATIREAELLKELKSRCSLTPQQRASTFADLVKLYKKNLEVRGRCSLNHGSMINVVCRELGHLKLDGFADNFAAYRKALIHSTTVHGKPRTSASVNRYTAIVRAAFEYGIKLDFLVKNPITLIRFPKLEEKPRDRYLNRDERLRLLNAFRKYRPDFQYIIEYMMLVPCRVSELVNAEREHYNPFTGTIYIPDSKSGDPIHKPVPEELKGYFNSIPVDCPWLFYQKIEQGKYRQLTHLRYAWAYCCKKAGIKNIRVHDLRHISATDLYENGNPERAIMDIAGWKTPMLSTYRHKDSLRSAQGIQFRSKTAIDSKSDVAFSHAV